MAQAKRTTMMAVAVMFGLGVLKSFLADGQAPTRRFVLGNAVAAGFLTMLTDIRPDIGKWFAYLVITGTAYAYIPPVADALGALDKAAAKGPASAPGSGAAAGDTATVATGATGAGMKGIDFLRGGVASPPPFGTVARRQNTRQRLPTVNA